MQTDELETLRLAYDDRVREAVRLRDARRAFTTQLGLPTSASLVVGAFAAFSESLDGRWLALAVVPFIIAVAVGARYSRRDPYRSIRRQVEQRDETDWLGLSPREWLSRRIAHEHEIYGELERSLDGERRGVQLVQVLVALQIVYVIVLAAA